MALAHRTLFSFLFLLFIFSNTLLAKESFISGNASYTDMEILPPHAKLEVTLEDISRMDIPAEILGQTISEPAGQLPLSFTLSFDDEKIMLGHRYAVRAKITVGKKLLYITDTINTVFSGNDDLKLNLIMKRIAKIPKTRVMEGMYKYMADAALFKDCVTGKYYPVSFEADNIALQKAYLEEVNGSNFYVRVELKGKLVKRQTMESKEEKYSLQVEQFIRILGLGDCTRQHSTVPILNNYWKLTLLYGKDIHLESNAREAHILLKNGLNGAGELKVVTGCNTILGDYKVDEQNIALHVKFSKEKRDECKNEMLEKDFMGALANTSYWRIEGEKLTLLDEMDNVLAIFQAIYF